MTVLTTIYKERRFIMNKITPAQLAKYFDQTLLKAYVSEADFEAFCKQSDAYGFAMVAINSAPVKFCKNILKDSSVHVGAAIRLPARPDHYRRQGV